MNVLLQCHPAYDRLVSEYRQARQVWRSNPGAREVARDWDWDERQYCDAYLVTFFAPLTWSASSVDPQAWNLTPAHMDAAFEEAGRVDAAP